MSFDEKAKDWDSDPKKVERAQRVAEAIRASMQPHAKMTALEIGCGTGLVSFNLQADFSSITLADTSTGMLDVLSAKVAASGVSNLLPCFFDLINDPLPASRFDAIYSLLALHHIPNTEAAIQRSYQLLNPGGWLCIADLDTEDGSFHAPDVTDIHRGFDRSVLRFLVEEAGFRRVSFETVYTMHKEIDGLDKCFPLFLLSACKEQHPS